MLFLLDLVCTVFPFFVCLKVELLFLGNPVTREFEVAAHTGSAGPGTVLDFVS